MPHYLVLHNQLLRLLLSETKKVSDILKRAKKTLIIEGNKTAQMAGVIKENTGIDIHNKFLKYDGRPFFPEEIVANVKKVK